MMFTNLPIGKNGIGLADFISSRVEYILALMFGLILLLVLVNSMLVAYRFITSQGKKEETDKAKRGLRAIFEGVIGFFVAIAGIVIIFSFFGVGVPDVALSQTCISSVGSVGCKACQEDINSELCKFCEAQYKRIESGEISLIELSSQKEGDYSGSQCI